MIARVIRALVALVGVALIGGAAALLFTPDAVEPALPVSTIAASQPLSDPLARTIVLVGLGISAASWIAWTTPSWGSSQSRLTRDSDPKAFDFETLRTDPPETASATPVVGETIEKRIAAAKGAPTGRQNDNIRDRLQSLAVETLVTVDGCSQRAARSRLTECSWTDDAVAAAYLADREAALPFWRRLLAWLRPAKTRQRRIERAADAIAAQLTAKPERDSNQGGRE